MMIQTVKCFIQAVVPVPAVLAALAVTALSGCVGVGGPPLQAGESESAVLARLGRPTHVLAIAGSNSHILEYMNGPFGQTTYFARIDGTGHLISYEQVLTSQTFAKVAIGTSTKADVIELIGTPSETSYLSLSELEVWSYPYKENPVADSMMHVHFDRAGIVRKMLNGPDPHRDPDHGLFGMGFGGLRRR